MVQTKCNGCNSYFKGSHGLSNHFQHNKKWKALHLNLNNQYQLSTNEQTKVNNDSKIKDDTESHRLNTIHCEIDQENIDSRNMHEESGIEDSSIVFFCIYTK